MLLHVMVRATTSQNVERGIYEYVDRQKDLCVFYANNLIIAKHQNCR